MAKDTEAKKRKIRRSTVYAVLTPFLEFYGAILKFNRTDPKAFADCIAEDEAERVIHFLERIHGR